MTDEKPSTETSPAPGEAPHEHEDWHDGGTHPLDPPEMPDESSGFVPDVAAAAQRVPPPET